MVYCCLIYPDIRFILECKYGTWGTNCSELCSANCLNNMCNNSDGYCQCMPGFKGPPSCQTSNISDIWKFTKTNILEEMHS